MENTEQYQKDLEAVRQNGYALQYVKNHTDEICLEAVKQNCFALALVDNQRLKEWRKFCDEANKPTNEADKGKVDLSEAKGRKTIRITFTYKPDEVTLNEIKKQGFRWYRSNWGAFYTEDWRAFYTEEKYNWAINKFAGTTLADIIVSDAGLGDDTII